MAERTGLRKYLEEGKEYITQNDPVQASEKLYKVVEECIKLLAEKYDLAEYQEAKREGSWWSKLLARASRELAQRFGEERIIDVWTKAFEIHRFGFHENSLRAEDIGRELPYIEWLLQFTEEALKEASK